MSAADIPELDNTKLQDKMRTDMFDYCRTHISDEETDAIKKSLGDYKFDDYSHLLPIEPDRYKTPEDLIIDKEHYKMRNLVLRSEKRGKPGMPVEELRAVLKRRDEL